MSKSKLPEKHASAAQILYRPVLVFLLFIRKSFDLNIFITSAQTPNGNKFWSCIRTKMINKCSTTLAGL